MSVDALTTIRVGHSPDSDDAFMFYALTHDKLDTGGLRFVHQLEDIETLNQRALKGELEVSAVSIHAFAYLADRYALLASGSSMGDRYGPTLVTREPMTLDDLRGRTIAIPGKLTTAYLTLQLCLGKDVPVVVMPFDQILPAVAEGRVEAGLLIHEGQLYYGERGLHKVVDLGEWWHEQTGLPLAAGGQRGPQGPGRGDGLADRPAPQGEHPLRARPSRGGPGVRPALRPRPRAGPGRSVRGDVRQRLDDRLRPEGPRGRPDTSGPRGGSGFSPGARLTYNLSDDPARPTDKRTSHAEFLQRPIDLPGGWPDRSSTTGSTP